MGLETQKRVAKLYREGYFQNNPVAKARADEFYPLDKKEVPKETKVSKPKPKEKKK
jgi:hypothetical protein